MVLAGPIRGRMALNTLRRLLLPDGTTARVSCLDTLFAKRHFLGEER